VHDEKEDVSTTALLIPPVVAALLEITLIAQAAWSAFQWAAGLFGLALSAYGVHKDCVKEFNTRECILSSVGLVTGALLTKYNVQSGFRCVFVSITIRFVVERCPR
jgi:hypothetical protein